jgi:ubiquitin C-terminal hydrolase
MHPARKAALEAERKEAARKKMLETRFPECRGKFAYKLQSKPTGLDHIGYNSYMNAVLQALAATLDPAKLYAERGKDAQFSTGYDNKTSDAVRKDKATRRLIDLIADMQRGQFKHLDADKLQSAFSHIHGNDKFRGVDEVDPKEFLESLMETIKCRYVDDTYRIQQRFESKCRKWSGKCKAGDVAARTYSDTYVLELDKPDPVGQRCKYPQYPQEVLKLKLEDLLRKKAALIQQVDCPCCKLDTARQNWAGFEEAPKVLTVSFKRVNDEPGKAKYKYQPELPESIDLCELGLLDANQKKGRYTLTSVVKHEGDSLEAGKYFNYTRTENGQWWRCYNASVGPVYFPAVNTNRDGQTHLAFYTLDN